VNPAFIDFVADAPQKTPAAVIAQAAIIIIREKMLDTFRIFERKD